MIADPAIPAEELALWADAQAGGAAAREALFSRFMPVARRIAWRFKRDHAATSLEIAELLQLASVGLLEAIDRFKPELGVPFRYYSTRRIAGAIAEGIGRHSEVNHQITTRRRMERERLHSLREQGDEPRSLGDKLKLIGEIAAELALGIMLEDSVMYLADERDPAAGAYETLAWKQASHQVIQTLDGLPERDRAIIRLHYLEGVPFDQIAGILGLSKGRISQLHKAALALLRKRLSDMGRFRLEG
ncbi:MAG: sigma-70 family RNA polymerase sigma factor [Novosphingobium sp.]